MATRAARIVALALCAACLAAAQTQLPAYTGQDRLKWFAKSSFGLESTGTGIFNSAWGTALNHPPEWRGTWEGFGKRLGTRTATITISNATEATLGAIWGEDPRYRTDHSGTWKQRVGRAMLQGIAAHNRQGHLMPAFAFYAGTVGNNLISNTWRPPTSTDGPSTALRVGYGFGGRMIGNGVEEFWPEIRKLMRKMKR